MDDVSHMNDVSTERIGRHWRWFCGRLHELDLVALRIGYVKPTTTVAAAFDVLRDTHPVCRKIQSQFFRACRVVGDMVETIDRRSTRGKRQYFDKLYRVEVIANSVRALRVFTLYST